MKILWVCNIMPPAVGEYLGVECSVKEGWISGILQAIAEREDLKLAICFPTQSREKKAPYEVKIETHKPGHSRTITCYEFYEDTARPEIYGGDKLEERMKEILKDYAPRLLHIFGTEYGHALAAARAYGKKESILVGLQGIVSLCAREYMADLPREVYLKVSFRDWLKKDSLIRQQEKFYLRGKREEELLNLVGNVTGRTEFDKNASRKINEALNYYSMNESMRKEFYNGKWELGGCKPYSVFFSQADYPLKGFHYLLDAACLLKDKYPSLRIRVAGNSLVKSHTLADKIKISAYGKYLRDRIREAGLEEHVSFLGKLSAEQMKEEYLSCHTYVCASSLENSPNSVAEAMLLGTPVVAACTGGIPSMVTTGKDGLLFEKGNSRQLAECLERIWEDKGLAEELSKNARSRAALAHNPEINYKRLLEIYRKIL